MSDCILTVGVIADTHVPDRVSNLHDGVIPTLKQYGVEKILHAGDICSKRVLEQLEQIAPVMAVRGNRDWVFARNLPWQRYFMLVGVKVFMTHGHGSLYSYIKDKFQYFKDGYRLERYQQRILSDSLDARIIIFGHTHRAVNIWHGERLLFNPGSAGCVWHDIPLSVGVLRFYANGRFEGEIVYLNGDSLNRQ